MSEKSWSEIEDKVEGMVAQLHLPDASEELAATADLEVVVEGVPLKLHSIVLASGSRVLRTALFAIETAATDTAASRSVAVQRVFEGFDPASVQSFVKLLYLPFSLEADAPAVGRSPNAYWRNLVAIADKLNAPTFLKAFDSYIAPKLPADSDWMAWLVLADGVQMRKVVAKCVKPAIGMHVDRVTPTIPNVKNRVAALGGLSLPTMQLMYEMVIKSVSLGGGRSSIFLNLPNDVSAWSAPGDLF